MRREFPLSQQARRADLLLLRRIGEREERPARTMRGLWPRISRVGLVEFKSPSHEFRRGDLIKLYSCGSEYLTLYRSEFSSVSELVLVLVNPSISRALLSEIEFIGGTLEPLGNGYARVVDGVHFLQTFIVATDEVAPAENDAYLSIFSHENMHDPEAARWFRRWLVQEVKIMGDPAQIEDFDEMLRKLYRMLPPEEVLRRTGLEPEEVLSALTPEQRLAGLSKAELKSVIDEARRRVEQAE